MKNFYNRLKFNHIKRLHRWQHTLAAALPCVLCGGAKDQPSPQTITPSLSDDLCPLEANDTQPTAQLIPYLCGHCLNLLPWYTQPRCPQCALPNISASLCGICLQHPPAFDRTLTTFRYAYPLAHLLHQFKYQQQLACGQWLATAMLSRLSCPTATDRPQVLMAMPMHEHRLRQRGFNHALELARIVGRAWQIPLVVEGCVRLIDTPTQTGMDMKTRTRSLRGAFSTRDTWQGQHILLVDDVMTTGASMHAVAKVLKQAGAKKVTALVLARTLKPD